MNNTETFVILFFILSFVIIFLVLLFYKNKKAKSFLDINKLRLNSSFLNIYDFNDFFKKHDEINEDNYYFILKNNVRLYVVYYDKKDYINSPKHLITEFLKIDFVNKNDISTFLNNYIFYIDKAETKELLDFLCKNNDAEKIKELNKKISTKINNIKDFNCFKQTEQNKEKFFDKKINNVFSLKNKQEKNKLNSINKYINSLKNEN